MSEQGPNSSADFRERVSSFLANEIRIETERVSWTRDRLTALRDERLRGLLRHAMEHSPWHARRLAGVDPDRISGNDLSSLPVMTKSDLVEHWDEIVTDRRLSRALVEEHVALLSEPPDSVDASDPGRGRPPAPLLDRYLALATSGSTGQGALLVYEGEEFARMVAPSLAHSAALAREREASRPAGPKLRVAVQAAAPFHGSAVVSWLLRRPGSESRVLPPSMPLDRIVEKLNEWRPTTLVAYPSMLGLLIGEARAGRLRIAPSSVQTGAEPLLQEIAEDVEMVFGVGVENVYAATEAGMIARSRPPAPELHLHEQIAVFEPVDFRHRLVAPGLRSDCMLLTNVVQKTLPLIRYRISDEVNVLEDAGPGPWPGRRIAPPSGRVEDLFVYPREGESPAVVHWQVLLAVLAPVQEILEFQVRQTARGVEILLRLDDPDIEHARIPHRTRRALERLGVPDPIVEVRAVDEIPHVPGSSKLRRFIARRANRSI